MRLLWTNMAFFPGQFPVTEGTILPMTGNGADAMAYTNALWDMWEDEEYGQALQDEWSEFKILLLHGSPGYPIGLSSEGSSPSDLAGRTIRAPAGGLTDLMTAIGANPVLTASGDLYTSMEKGILDGYLIDYCGIKGFALEEVTNYALDLNVLNITMMILMTQETWDSLSPEVQAAFEEYSYRDGSLAMAEASQADADAMIEVFESSDRLITPSEADLEAWQEAAASVQDQWVADNASLLDSQGFLDRFMELTAQYAQAD